MDRSGVSVITKATNNKQTKQPTMAVNVRPLADRVIVKPLEASEVKKGGIIIPDAHKEKPQEGEVVALGTGKRDEDGKIIAFTVKKGDKVLISKYGGTEIKIDGDAYLIMREDDILGIIG
jgi:chaperonin GroES